MLTYGNVAAWWSGGNFSLIVFLMKYFSYHKWSTCVMYLQCSQARLVTRRYLLSEYCCGVQYKLDIDP